MSGMEVIAVVGCVAAVISAYQHADEFVQKIREKRARKKLGALPPESLHRSLAMGPPAINRMNDDGTRRFGKAFAVGDGMARAELTGIIIEIQGRMITSLTMALEDDRGTSNFNELVDVSETGRVQSVTALGSLLKRLLEQAEIERMISGTAGLGLEQLTSSHGSFQPSYEAYRDALHAIEGRPVAYALDAQSGSQTSHPATPNLPRAPATFSSSASPTSSSHSSGPTESTPSSRRSKGIRLISFKRTSSSNVDLRGFCEGACALRTGNKGMILRNQSTAFTGQSLYFGCSNKKCSFEAPAVRSNKQWALEDAIYTAHGVRYRWSFLAKSHLVPTHKIEKSNYDYQCVFCSAQGDQPKVARGASAFIEHVGSHRGDRRNPFGMHLIKAEFGRTALQVESWDVNLLPLVSELDVESSSPTLCTAAGEVDSQSNCKMDGSLSTQPPAGDSLHESEVPLTIDHRSSYHEDVAGDYEGGSNVRPPDIPHKRSMEGSAVNVALEQSMASIHPALREPFESMAPTDTTSREAANQQPSPIRPDSTLIPDPWRYSYATLRNEF
ncbi:MAG: hypothetical protein OHK93_003123 [Ramalina farinacea]|uniref:Uncharacterized protein n=1 Tax=Ramalina farinacea TaxID=258253 RepID=A0AA43U0Z9_9LECA|nr:hypothetical protein [Ramalina farinacea]